MNKEIERIIRRIYFKYGEIDNIEEVTKAIEQYVIKARKPFEDRVNILEKLLSHYRIGTPPSENTMKELERTKLIIAELKQGLIQPQVGGE